MDSGANEHHILLDDGITAHPNMYHNSYASEVYYQSPSIKVGHQEWQERNRKIEAMKLRREKPKMHVQTPPPVWLSSAEQFLPSANANLLQTKVVISNS